MYHMKVFCKEVQFILDQLVCSVQICNLVEQSEIAVQGRGKYLPLPCFGDSHSKSEQIFSYLKEGSCVPKLEVEL